ncbi:MAG: NADH:flavin oxidoreductase [Leptolyngbyaceae bacterium]|nr:NADH:flavin oxidoreductase [Leptolyngbyaceae bacterium]
METANSFSGISASKTVKSTSPQHPYAMSIDTTVLDPIHFRSHLTVKNRVFRSSVTGRWDNYDGSGNQARVNWENKFAKGGVGAIISSYVPVSRDGQITPQVATIDDDAHIPFWHIVGKTVHQHDCKYIIQLSHSGRQRDIEGIENTLIDPRTKAIAPKRAPSTTNEADQINGLPANNMPVAEVKRIIQDFAAAAGRAKEAGLDGIELHSSHGYLINQFLSAGINRRTPDQGYGGDLSGRYQFLKEIVQAIRQEVGPDFHLQAKISVQEFNNIIPPWSHAGNTFDDGIQICQWLEEDGVDAIHVSRGSTFPHPLLPSGPFPFEMLRYTFDTMTSSGGKSSFRNQILFRYRFLHSLFQWIWGRLPRKIDGRYEQPVHGLEIQEEWLDSHFKEHVSTDTVQTLLKKHQGTVLRDAKVVKDALQEIPVITTGGFQQASYINAAIQEGYTDAVSMARMLVANNDLVKTYFEHGKDIADRPCTYCNNCLGAYLEVPVGCHDIDRFYQRSIQGLSQDDAYKAAQEALSAKNEEVMSVFKPLAKPFVPS